MTTHRGTRAPLSLLAVAALACARAPEARTDSAVAAAARDSVAAAEAVAAAPSPPASATDTGPAPPAPGGRDSATPNAPSPAAPNAAPSARPGATPTATPSETVLTGKVVAGGVAAAPVTTLQIEGGRPTALVGPLEPELRRLGGATVWVAGAPATGGPTPSFTVTRYEIVAIDGVRPVVGTLAVRDGTTWLAGRDTIKLASVPAELRAKVGAKVWIAGRRSGAELVVQSYGVIREP